MRRLPGLRVCSLQTPTPSRQRVAFLLGNFTRAHRSWSSSALPPLKLLRHEHLRGDEPGGMTLYEAAEAAQEQHRSQFLAWKTLSEDQRSTIEPPRPLLISFETAPVFTLGRRQDALTPDQTSRLERPLTVDLPHREEPIRSIYKPEVRKTSRGGLTTYHGPGQLVLWPVLDMHSPLYARHSVASYARHLETATRRLLAEQFGTSTYVDRDEPGVWVAAAASSSGAREPPRKIAALGVHHRRHVTALGIALNVDAAVAGGEGANPWARFVPCGLEGKLVTSVEAEMGPAAAEGRRWDLGELAGRWARIFEDGLRDVAKRTMDGKGER